MLGNTNLFIKNVVSLGWALLLSAFTLILGAVPLLILRRRSGRGWFWWAVIIAASMLAALGQFPMFILFTTVAVLIGSYVEFDDAQAPLFYSLAGATAVASGYLGIALGVTFRITQVKLLGFVKQWVTTVVEQAHRIQPNLNLEAKSLYQQIPSLVIIAMVFALVLAVAFEQIMRSEEGAAQQIGGSQRASLVTKFYVPDLGVWLMCAALLASFSSNRAETVEVIGVNSLNILVVLYFLQGLSVAAKLFSVYKIATGWQILWYFLLTFKLFLIVSVVGFVDYWLDFRRWISKKMAEMN